MSEIVEFARPIKSKQFLFKSILEYVYLLYLHLSNRVIIQIKFNTLTLWNSFSSESDCSASFNAFSVSPSCR